jgi:hypothetical protein
MNWWCPSPAKNASQLQTSMAAEDLGRVPGDCTDTYTTTDEWGGQRTFSADGTFLSYFREMRLVLHETPEEREEFLRMAQVVQQLRFSRAPGPPLDVVAYAPNH